MASDEGERAWEVLEEIAEEQGVAPEALLEGKVNVFQSDVNRDRRAQAFLCICSNSDCSRLTGCENTYCSKHR